MGWLGLVHLPGYLSIGIVFAPAKLAPPQHMYAV